MKRVVFGLVSLIIGILLLSTPSVSSALGVFFFIFGISQLVQGVIQVSSDKASRDGRASKDKQ